ncbi:parvulin-like peptidyl-prolyl isomerase [Saprospira grandis DSM 2844]|uniref:Parvulin-like peptidyl-prolyl isomerase n=1 Tax=Saprospira grandis DSM 2844 TaxID=694433 RepID=J1I698_9BACT|nr:peptidylprolyl isomerase [Saprospira grandis]EJF53913.1 parvulin-like peptidyl-prolyl isomerase [Saprospira grandis DSM 2844]
MMKMHSIMAFCLFFLAGQVWAHQPNSGVPSSEDDPILFTVKGVEVRLSEFTYIYDKTNGDKADYSKKSLEEYLDLYINFKLQVVKGQEMGLDKKPEVLREQNQYKRQLSSSYLTDREITEKLVKEAFDRAQEDRRFSQIFIKLGENAEETAVKEAYARMKKLQQEVTAENFETMVGKYSEDSYSKGKKGDLGFFTVLQLPYALENALYETQKGAVSEIVRSKYGLHLLKVTEVRPAYGQIQLAHILIRPKKEGGEEKAKAKIDSLHGVLKAGQATFAELAAKYSQDNSSKTRAGIIGWVGINQFDASFEAAAFGLPKDGVYGEPVKSESGWHILRRVKSMDKSSYPQMKSELTAKVKRDPRFKLVETALVSKIKEEAGYQLDEKVYAEVIAALRQDQAFIQGRWTPKPELLKNEKVVFSLGNLNATVKELIQMAQRSPNERFAMRPRRHEDALERVLAKLVAQKSLAYEETRLEEKYPEFKALLREYEEGILLFEVKKQLIWDKASNDEEGLKAFYESHKEDYQWNERAKVTFYTLRSVDKKEIKKLRKKAKKKTAQEVMELFNADKALVQTTEATYEKGRNAEVDAIKWKARKMNKGYTKDGSYYFIKIEEVIPASNKSLDEARGYVVADFQDQLEKDLILSLREEYEIKINKEALNKIVKK